MAHDIQDFLRRGRPLDPFFAPHAVAVIGATETPRSVGRTILWNLIANPFGGTVFPVNPHRPSVLGIRAYPSIREVPAKVDLAVIVTPATAVPDVVHDCVDAGVKAAVVISAGFREIGPQGIELERRLLAEARRGRMRIVGPNCLGIMSPTTGLNATFAKGMARPGNIAFLSQSGALLTAILDWSLREQLGFSAFVSTGSMVDVTWGDLIDYLGDDPRTHAILIYMESVGDARAFLSAAREVALQKPIILIKAGRSEAAARAAASHTGTLVGSDDVLQAAFRRVGVLRVERIAELFHMAEVLAKQPRPAGPKLAVVTNAGGPAVLATDALIALGGELATLSDPTLRELDTFLPKAWSHANPVDILGDADPSRFERAVEVVARDPGSDGLLVVLTPQDMTDPTLTAEALTHHTKIEGKPVLASWMGSADVQAGVDILNRAGVPTFDYPDTAARAFCSMWRYAYNLRALYETPVSADDGETHPDQATAVIARVRAEGRELLDELESKELLGAYAIPTVPTLTAQSAEEAVAQARGLGYPVVLKLRSRTITHKTDVGGVVLNLVDDVAVAKAFAGIRESVARRAGAAHFQGVTVQPMVRAADGYELIIGSSVDPQFGPVMLFGAGGQLVEVLQDRALAIPPLTATLARRLMAETRIARALSGVRGRKAVDLAALEQLLVRFGQLVTEQTWVREIDVNPLCVWPGGMMALDARVVLHPPNVKESDLPRPAIRPYPRQYVGELRLRDGARVLVRPIRPEDEPLMVEFHKTLGTRTVELRYLRPLALDERTTHERLVRVCFNDYDREIALVAEHRPADGAREIVGVGRLTKVPGQPEGEFAVIVSDKWQGRGLGSELLRRVVEIARDERLERLVAEIAADNLLMQRISSRLGFSVKEAIPGEPSVRAELTLRDR